MFTLEEKEFINKVIILLCVVIQNNLNDDIINKECKILENQFDEFTATNFHFYQKHPELDPVLSLHFTYLKNTVYIWDDTDDNDTLICVLFKNDIWNIPNIIQNFAPKIYDTMWLLWVEYDE